MNYKGIYFNDDPNSKFTDPETGAHFAFKDMCARLNHVLKWRRQMEKQILNQLLPKQQQQRVLYTDENERDASKDRETQLRFEKEEFMKKMGKVNLNKIKMREKTDSKDNKANKVTLGDNAPEAPKIVIKQSQIIPVGQAMGTVGKASNKQLEKSESFEIIAKIGVQNKQQ